MATKTVVRSTLLVYHRRALRDQHLLRRLLSQLRRRTDLVLNKHNTRSLHALFPVNPRRMRNSTTKRHQLSILAQRISVRVTSSTRPLSINILLRPTRGQNRSPRRLPQVQIGQLTNPLTLHVARDIRTRGRLISTD